MVHWSTARSTQSLPRRSIGTLYEAHGSAAAVEVEDVGAGAGPVARTSATGAHSHSMVAGGLLLMS